jgi:predicted permease
MGMMQRVKNLFQRERIDADIEEELRSHLDMAAEDALRAGMSPQEARRAARLRFGNPQAMKERVHTADVALGLDRLYRDLRQALRQLRRSPGFTTMAVLTLALGIGATTAIFTLVYDVMLRPLPFAHPDRLVTIQEKVAEWSSIYPVLPVSANHFALWQRYNRSFQAMALMEEYAEPMGAAGHPLQVGVLSATPGVFPVLQVQPKLGRQFTKAEAQPGRDHVVVLMDSLWRDRFGADPGIVGRTITLDGFPYTVIGVMPRSFHMPSINATATFGDANRQAPLGAIVPLAFTQERLAEQMNDLDYFGLGRLKPGVSLAAANADLDALQHAISANLPADEKATLSAALTPFQQELVGSNQKPLMILLVAVAGLLLVGCVNIANLLLARAVGQRQQMAVVAALGASRAEMVRMAFRETLVLAIAGCALGILPAAAIVPLMQRYLPVALDFRGPVHLDWAGAACALSLALVTMLAAGAAPAWMASRTAPQAVLHSEARLAGEARGSRRTRRVLVGVEAAVSAALLLLTGLLTASLVKLMHVHRGFTVEHTMTAMVNLPTEQYPDHRHRAAFYRELLPRLERLPGVEHAAIVSVLPLTGGGGGMTAQLPGDPRPITQLPIESFLSVSSWYFRTIQIPLISGHFFTPGDWGQNLAVISEKTARTLWPGKDPVGRHFRDAGTGEKPFTVIGIVGNARTVSLSRYDPMIIYLPYWYRLDGTTGLVVRTHQDPGSMANAIRQTVWSVDRSASVPTVCALGTIVADSVANQRFVMDLLLLFAGSALFLAGLGVYGVVTYSVAQRHREIGLRLALGASRGSLYRLVLRDGLPPIVLGTVAGVAIAFAMARIMGALLFEVSPYDPLVALASICVLLAIGTAACLLPAREAAGVEPMQALRAD